MKTSCYLSHATRIRKKSLYTCFRRRWRTSCAWGTDEKQAGKIRESCQQEVNTQEERVQKGMHYYIFSQFLPGDISFLEKNKWIFISIYCVPDMHLHVISLLSQ